MNTENMAQHTSVETAKADDSPHPAGFASFVEVTIACPGFWMRFKATQERVSRVMAFMLKEATEAEAEYEQSLKPQTLGIVTDENRSSSHPG